MRYLLIILILSGCTSMQTISGYGLNTHLKPIDHSCGEEMSTYGVGIYKKIDRLSYGFEINHDLRADSINGRLVITYDFIQKEWGYVFVGVGGGIGYANKDDYKLLTSEHGSEGLVGVLDARIGLSVKITERLNLIMRVGLDHISRIGEPDPGSNCDSGVIGLEWEF